MGLPLAGCAAAMQPVAKLLWTFVSVFMIVIAVIIHNKEIIIIWVGFINRTHLKPVTWQ